MDVQRRSRVFKNGVDKTKKQNFVQTYVKDSLLFRSKLPKTLCGHYRMTALPTTPLIFVLIFLIYLINQNILSMFQKKNFENFLSVLSYLF